MCKHVCAWFEFELADCFSEHGWVQFDLFAVGLCDMFPRCAFLVWWSYEGIRAESCGSEVDFFVTQTFSFDISRHHPTSADLPASPSSNVQIKTFTFRKPPLRHFPLSSTKSSQTSNFIIIRCPKYVHFGRCRQVHLHFLNSISFAENLLHKHSLQSNYRTSALVVVDRGPIRSLT